MGESLDPKVDSQDCNATGTIHCVQISTSGIMTAGLGICYFSTFNTIADK